MRARWWGLTLAGACYVPSEPAVHVRQVQSGRCINRSRIVVVNLGARRSSDCALLEAAVAGVAHGRALELGIPPSDTTRIRAAIVMDVLIKDLSPPGASPTAGQTEHYCQVEMLIDDHTHLAMEIDCSTGTVGQMSTRGEAFDFTPYLDDPGGVPTSVRASGQGAA